jgi:hypothetical protein
MQPHLRPLGPGFVLGMKLYIGCLVLFNRHNEELYGAKQTKIIIAILMHAANGTINTERLAKVRLDQMKQGTGTSACQKTGRRIAPRVCGGSQGVARPIIAG